MIPPLQGLANGRHLDLCRCLINNYLTNIYRVPALYQAPKYGYRDKKVTALSWKDSVKWSKETCKYKGRHSKGNVNRDSRKYYGSPEDTDVRGNVRNVGQVHHFWHHNICLLYSSETHLSHITLTYLPQGKQEEEGLGETLHHLYKLDSQCSADVLNLLYKEPIVGITQWPTQEICYQMVPSCSSALWAVKGRHVVGSASIATGSFMESQVVKKEDGPVSPIFREKKNKWMAK